MLNQAQWQVERLDEKVTGRIKRTVEKLQTWIERTEQVVEQTDRGFATAKNERTLEERGVKRVSLPQRGKLSAKRKAVQKQFWFRRLQKWRAGGAWRR